MSAIDEYTFFKENFDKLYDKYADKYLLIKDAKVQSAFDDFDSAITAGEEMFGLGNFIVQQCVPEEKRIMYTSRRVAFAAV